ncbi:MAG TPA: carboxypeptidase-like regulatory domain-containing protein, partial [Polyangiaceae bacterium]|nr:carboxypeptidase-like regulatory domain-containing protein [Polyangiaceae bacterium]
LERETQILTLATRPEPALAPGEAVESIRISLLVARDRVPAHSLGSASVEIGSNAEFRVPSRAFGAPGPLELSAEFSGSASTRTARTLTHVTSTALAVLSLAEPIAASHPESGVHIRVRVSSVAGAVPSGSVEARSAGVSLGSARVANGLAELDVQLEEGAAKARPLELHYVADSPWWLPAAALSVEVPILPPSPWRRIAWIAAVTALGTWLLVGWQRPRRIERAATSNTDRETVRAPVDVIELGDARGGWRGRVLDAHDGTPIANAVVLVRLPAFDASGVQRTALTDGSGAFTLDGGGAGPGAALEVRAPFHTPLAAAMPPPGTLVLSLTSRRRTLLARFVAWAGRDGGWERRGEATPGEVALRTDRAEVATWALAVDEAAFGPDVLSEAKEQSVVGREPSHNRKPS